MQNGGPFALNFTSRHVCTVPPSPYTKPHKSPADLIAHLTRCGLSIADHSQATTAIEEIGYNRLRIYFLSRRDKSLPSKPFRVGATFDEIIQIYRFDEKLRTLCFQACTRVEIIFKNAISEVLSSNYGAHPYFDPNVFRDTISHVDAVKAIADLYHKNVQKDQRAKHYAETYNPPVLPPIWLIKDLMTFGTANLFHEKLSSHIKGSISKRLSVIDHKIFNNWIKAIIDLRNACAHHDRIFNRSFQKDVIRYKKISVPSGTEQTNKIFHLLECIQHMVRTYEPSYDCIGEVRALIGTVPVIKPHEVGF